MSEKKTIVVNPEYYVKDDDDDYEDDYEDDNDDDYEDEDNEDDYEDNDDDYEDDEDEDEYEEQQKILEQDEDDEYYEDDEDDTTTIATKEDIANIREILTHFRSEVTQKEDELDIDNLLRALDTEQDVSILNLTYKKIEADKQEILRQLCLSPDVVDEYMIKLKDYRRVITPNEMELYHYIRWIPLTTPGVIDLKKGGRIMDIYNNDLGEVVIKVMLLNTRHKFCITVRLDANIFFKKITEAEKIILSVVSHLDGS
jgi:hypothetical protein